MLGWTDERVEQLRKLWSEGLSASQIAAQMGGGITRNAVIGKVHRLGLSGRTKTASTAPRPAARPKSRSSGLSRSHPLVFGANALKMEARPDPNAAPRPAAEPIPFPAPSPEARVTILQLNEKTCRWPEGDPASSEFRFCGSQTAMGIPYCPYHAAIAYQPSADRKREKRAAGAGR